MLWSAAVCGASNPALSPAQRAALVDQLMQARRAVKDAKRGCGELAHARAAVNDAKTALGERGPVWWDDGHPITIANSSCTRLTPSEMVQQANNEERRYIARQRCRSTLLPVRC